MWSPHHSDQFVVSGNSLRLYKLKSISRNIENFSVWKTEDILESESNKLVALGSTEIQSLKCFDWCLDENKPFLFSVGLNNGRVLLTDLMDDSKKLKKEFISSSQTTRACNVVAWNPIQKNILATGLDKARVDFSCFIWDVLSSGQNSKVDEKPSTGIKRSVYNVSSFEATEKMDTPYQKFASNETIASLCWLPNDAYSLAFGTGKKWLRIYDIRSVNKPVSSFSAHTSKAVYGVCFDPHNNNCMATFSEDPNIKLWDIRNLNSEPVLTLPTSSKVLQISWCAARGPGILGSLCKDDPFIKVWDINSGASWEDIHEQKERVHDIMYTSETYKVNEKTTSFSWNPKSGKLLAVNNDIIELLPIREDFPLSFSPHSRIAVANRKKAAEGALGINDISLIMYERAKKGYSGDIAFNKDFDFGDQDLSFIWNWVYEMKYVFSKGKTGDIKGVLSIITSKLQNIKMSNLPFELSDYFPIYNSPERYICQKMCGWNFRSTEGLVEMVRRFQKENQIERAVSISVFNQNIELAVSVIEESMEHFIDEKDDIQLIIMALKGFKNLKNTGYWQSVCDSLKSRISNPYLKCILSFLFSANYQEEILGNTDISISDRIAFACRYLEQEKLFAYLNDLLIKVVKEGQLSGLLLTGIDSYGPGVDLLQNYIDRTGDIQTASLLLSLVPPKKEKSNVQNVIQLYRNLLDRWQLWTERAKFDVSRGMNYDIAPPPQVYVRCNYCSRSLEVGKHPQKPSYIIPGSYGVHGLTLPRIPQDKLKISSCPYCRKPLPRCALCLLPLDCVIPNIENRKEMNDGRKWGSGKSDFDTWFSWCQTCKHGGHAQHILKWFQENEVCPVSDCECRCYNK